MSPGEGGCERTPGATFALPLTETVISASLTTPRRRERIRARLAVCLIPYHPRRWPDISGGVADARVAEVATHLLWPPLGAPEIAPHVADQLALVPGALPPHGVGLDGMEALRLQTAKILPSTHHGRSRREEAQHHAVYRVRCP